MRRLVAVLTALCATGAVVFVGASGAAQPTPKPGPKPTAKLTIGASLNPVTYGRSTFIRGHLTRTPNAAQRVTLAQDAFPFDRFRTTASMLTDAAGNYAFQRFPPRHTRYRVSSSRAADVLLTVFVRKRVTLGVSDTTPSDGQRVRFFGRVLPAHNGMTLAIQRFFNGRFRTIARTLLVAGVGNASRYSRRVKITHSGLYRARVGADADHLAGTSRRVTLTVS